MTPHRILQLNALSTAACAIGMLATRGTLPSLFGLATCSRPFNTAPPGRSQLGH